MARDGGANATANQQMSAIQQDQVARANTATDKYNADLGTLKSGGKIAANPWQDPSYLRNSNEKMAAGTSSANDAAADQLNRQALRTGENGAATKATIAGLARDKMRTMGALQSGQAADDYGKFQDYQKGILGADLAPTGADTTMFGTATQGRDSALNNITSMANASQAMWGNIIGAGLQAGGTVGAKAV